MDLESGCLGGSGSKGRVFDALKFKNVQLKSENSLIEEERGLYEDFLT